ncbi:HEAT repeat containing protein, putative [Babesia ovata]|uniref:HEAT repeat containing protein, putative n=1 Tax=Babesia ovata TaxID=189622 RepID=A0A2H6K9D4_9APIC|nr:HEAT repeat containing protein, putative [Babesia ovata]GBE59614.1 HEAT repeat containing protein, putative [Babesia ovata]
MEAPVRVKLEPVSESFPTRLPDPAALMCNKLMSCPSLSLQHLLEGSDAERAEKTQLLTLQLSRCHQSERFDFQSDGAVFCTLLRTASTPLQAKVCELLVAYLKAAQVDNDLVDNDEGIRSAESLLSFYRLLHDDMVEYALPNVKAGDQCALFICNLLSICSSHKVFGAIVDMFGTSVRLLLPSNSSGGTAPELSVDNARRVIGIMKTLLFLTKAFGAPTIPSEALCGIASSVITGTRTHLCRLYSYNVLAFLLRNTTSEDEIKAALPDLSASQLRRVLTLLKEANHLGDTTSWSFQRKPRAPAASPLQAPASSASPRNVETATAVVSSETVAETSAVPAAIQQLPATPLKPTVAEKHSSPALPTHLMSSAMTDTAHAVAAAATPLPVRRNNAADALNESAGNTSANSTVVTTVTATTRGVFRASNRPPFNRNSSANSTAAPTSQRPLPTSNHVDQAPSAESQSSSVELFKSEWIKRLSSQFTYSGQDTKSGNYDREAWKAKRDVLMSVVDQVQRVPCRLNMGPSGTQVVGILEGILRFESAIPIVLGALQFLGILLDKCGEGFMRQVKTPCLADLVFDRLKDSNGKVQGAAVHCVAWMIKYGDGTMVFEAVKKSLCHKSPLARIAMCNIISGTAVLPDSLDNISQELQSHKSQLIPVLSSLTLDKNAKVRSAAIESRRALEDPSCTKPSARQTAVPSAVIRPVPPINGPRVTDGGGRPASSLRPKVGNAGPPAGSRVPPGGAPPVDDVEMDTTSAAPSTTPASAPSAAAPAKRKLVRRFLKKSLRKHGNGAGVSVSAPCATATSSCETAPTEASYASVPSNAMEVDLPIASTSADIDLDETVPDGMSMPSALTAPPAEDHVSSSVVEGSNLEDMDDSTKRLAVDAKGGVATPPLASVVRRVMPAAKEARVRPVPPEPRLSEGITADDVSTLFVPSEAESTLLNHVDSSILNKISRRGSSRRSLAEGLYELSMWLKGHSDLASALEQSILRFLGECTHNFSEQSKTGKAALYSFMEDFIACGVTSESAAMLIAAMSTDVRNPKVASLMKQLSASCDSNAFFAALLVDGKSSADSCESSAMLELILTLLTPELVGNLSGTTVGIIVSYCARLSSSDGGNVSLLAAKVLDAIDSAPTPDVDEHVSPAAEVEAVSRSPKPDVPTASQVDSSPVPAPGYRATSTASSGTSPINDGVLAAAFEICLPSAVRDSTKVIATPSPPAGHSEGSSSSRHNALDLPDKFSNALLFASMRMKEKLYRDLYCCMFESNGESGLMRACTFWETFLQQPRDLLSGMLFAENNVRLELLTWLCCTLLRGLCENQVYRCFDRLFAKVKEMGLKLSVDESARVLDALAIYRERNQGNALLLFDHLMQVTNVTTELLSACSSPCVWQAALCERMASPIVPGSMPISQPASPVSPQRVSTVVRSEEVPKTSSLRDMACTSPVATSNVDVPGCAEVSGKSPMDGEAIRSDKSSVSSISEEQEITGRNSVTKFRISSVRTSTETGHKTPCGPSPVLAASAVIGNKALSPSNKAEQLVKMNGEVSIGRHSVGTVAVASTLDATSPSKSATASSKSILLSSASAPPSFGTNSASNTRQRISVVVGGSPLSPKTPRLSQTAQQGCNGESPCVSARLPVAKQPRISEPLTPKLSKLPDAPSTEVVEAPDKVVCDVRTDHLVVDTGQMSPSHVTNLSPIPMATTKSRESGTEGRRSVTFALEGSVRCTPTAEISPPSDASTEPGAMIFDNHVSENVSGDGPASGVGEKVVHSTASPVLDRVSPVPLDLGQEDHDEDYGSFPADVLQKGVYQRHTGKDPVRGVSLHADAVSDMGVSSPVRNKREACEIGIQTTPSVNVVAQGTDECMLPADVIGNDAEDVPPAFGAATAVDVTNATTTSGVADGANGSDMGSNTTKSAATYGTHVSDAVNGSMYPAVVSSASSAAVESARSSVSRILSRHLRCESVESDCESSVLLRRYMKMVESILSDCSYIANFCLLSNYQDYHGLVPSFYDEGIIESCLERANRILENLAAFPDQQVVSALSPVLVDACHISILRLCKEVEDFSRVGVSTDKVVEAIVALVELFTIASGQLDGRSLLQYCAVVIHCLALPKECFHRNLKLYNGLSRLISVNALEQGVDVLSRLLVICVELSVQSLRRGDGGRILLAMLRLTKILQVQVMTRMHYKKCMSPVTRSELYKSHSTYVGMLRDYLRGAYCKSTVEPRLQEAVRQSSKLLRSLCESGDT